MSLCGSACAELGPYYGEKTTRDVTSDVTILVGSKAYKCHKFVLMSHSNWLNRKIVEKSDDASPTIILSGMSERVFDKIYKWMYTCKTKFNEDLLLDIMEAAKFLGMTKLVEALSTHFPSDLSPVNVMVQFANALEAGYDFKSRSIANYISKHFREIVAHKMFLVYSPQEISWLLAINELDIKSETEVLNAAMNWLRHRWPERRHYISHVMTWVRFGLISDGDLVEFAFSKRHYPISTTAKVREMMLRALLYHIVMENNMIDIRFLELQPLDRLTVSAPHKAYLRVVCSDPCHPTLYPNVIHVSHERKARAAPEELDHFCNAGTPQPSPNYVPSMSINQHAIQTGKPSHKQAITSLLPSGKTERAFSTVEDEEQKVQTISLARLGHRLVTDPSLLKIKQKTDFVPINLQGISKKRKPRNNEEFEFQICSSSCSSFGTSESRTPDTDKELLDFRKIPLVPSTKSHTSLESSPERSIEEKDLFRLKSSTTQIIVPIAFDES